MVEELAQELQQSVDEYIKTYRPGDTQEWQFVLQEINLFLKVFLLFFFIISLN